MRIAYAIQGEVGVSAELRKMIEDSGGDIFLLTWGSPVDGAIFFPNSTWTDGRNRLYQELKGLDYDYFTFLDEDVDISSNKEGNPVVHFKTLLEKYKPAIGVPYYPYYNKEENFETGDISTNYSFDACFTAIRADVLDKLLPYNNAYDSDSWWLSQFFFIHMSRLLYHSDIIITNDVKVKNLLSRPYPRRRYFTKWSKIFYDTISKEHIIYFRPYICHEVMKFSNCSEELSIGDIFNENSEYWKNYNNLRGGVSSGGKEHFSQESIKWEKFHKENGTIKTMEKFGGLVKRQDISIKEKGREKSSCQTLFKDNEIYKNVSPVNEVVKKYQTHGYDIMLNDQTKGVHIKKFDEAEIHLDPEVKNGLKDPIGYGCSTKDIDLFIQASKIIKAKNVFVIGNAWGFSTFCLAEVFQDANVDTIDAETQEVSKLCSNITRDIIEDYYPDRVRLTIGSSPIDLDKAVRKGITYDLVFVDGYHFNESVWADYRGILPYLSTKCIVFFHDTRIFNMDDAMKRIEEDSKRHGFDQFCADIIGSYFGMGFISRGIEISFKESDEENLPPTTMNFR